MSDISKYRTKPTAIPVINQNSFKRFGLSENPFPAAPTINQESEDARYNGDIYERYIRQSEREKIVRDFLSVPQNDINHLRLGYLIDTSYIGRGNGKSAFLVNIQKEINRDFCLTISNGVNRCFALTISPEPSGRTKTFANFVDLFAETIFKGSLIEDVLATLRLEAILTVDSNFSVENNFDNEEDLRIKLNSERWFDDTKTDYRKVHQQILSNPYLQSLPPEFPLYVSNMLINRFSTKEGFIKYYHSLKPGKPRIEFVFSQLVSLLLAANYNGAYIFVDDFERIPDFQSERQKRDFALELRTCLFDGGYTNSRIGFYNFLLVLHAGVPRLIQKAWEQSGLEHRTPMFYKGTPRHIIPFEKITLEHVFLLVQKYLDEYRINPDEKRTLTPFTKEAISRIAEQSEFNASRILKTCYEVLERAVSQEAQEIDLDFLNTADELSFDEGIQSSGIHDAPTRNLMDSAHNEA